MFKALFKKGEKRRNDTAYEALVAAFCLVSYADGHLHVAELSRFIRLQARENPGLIPDEDKLVHDIVTYGKDFAKDYGKARARALALLAETAKDPALARQIVKVVRIAAISDNHITPSEDSAAIDIARALGLREDI
jgi:tellurite resistance protein